mgnify:CR=1 FL=1
MSNLMQVSMKEHFLKQTSSYSWAEDIHHMIMKERIRKGLETLPENVL